MKWKIVSDHKAENPPTAYTQHGVVNFDPTRFNNIDTKSDDYNHPFLHLLLCLWPGEWRDQLEKMNRTIRANNAGLTPTKQTKECTEDEWWKIWGIMIFAAKAGKGGINKLYDKRVSVLKQLPNIDLSDVMPMYRAQQLIKNIPYAFEGEDDTDPWNRIRGLVNGFNNARAQRVAASFCKVLDESMSSWNPTTTKYGGLPFLSFILRKPEPLGTEFKVMACTETGE